MNLPVVPVLPDSSSITAAAASAASQSVAGAKTALTAQSGSDASNASFDHVFANVDDNGGQTSPASSSYKGQVKTGASAKGQASSKGQVKTAIGSGASTPADGADQSGPAALDTVSAARAGALLSAKAAISAIATTEAAPSPNSGSASNAKLGDRVPHKKPANADNNAAASDTDAVATSSIPAALTVDQMAAALAVSASAPAVIQNLNTVPSSSADSTGVDTMTLKGGKGRSVAEVLAQGTPVLNYQVESNASELTQSSDPKAAASALVRSTALNSDASLTVASSTATDDADGNATIPGPLDPNAATANAASISPRHQHSAAANLTQGSAANATNTVNLSSPSPAASTPFSPNLARAAGEQTALPNQTALTTAQTAVLQTTATDASAESAAGAIASGDSNSSAVAKSAAGTNTASNNNKSVAPTTARGAGLTAWQKPAGAVHGLAEKFADGGGRQNASGDDSSNRFAKNTSLDSDNKGLVNSTTKVGTDTAIGRAPMSFNLHASATSAATSDVFAPASSSAAGTTADTHAIAVSHASALVHQINEIGEGLWRVDRQSVEVNFNFGDKDHLLVRVEYKNGQVQATFDTSSTELRTAITQAWNSQNSSSGDRSYKMAEPVFTSSSNSSFSSGEDASSNSRQFASFQDVSNFAGSSRSRSSASTVSAPASTSSRASLRPEVAGHLNAIV